MSVTTTKTTSSSRLAGAEQDSSYIPRGPITTGFNFFQEPTDGAKPYNIVEKPTDGSPQQNYGVDNEPVSLTDIRGHESGFDLDKDAFQVLQKIESKMTYKDWENDAKIRSVYYPEVEKTLLDNVPGSHKVTLFDYTIRRNEPDAFRAPVHRVHVDQTARSTELRVRLHNPDEAEQLLKGRYRIINVWRPLNGPVQDNPLAFASADTVDDKDLIPIEHRYPHRTGETAGVRYNKSQKWYYWSGMQNDERLLLKCSDNKVGVGQRVPHTAFVDPRTPAGARGRESIEARLAISHCKFCANSVQILRLENHRQYRLGRIGTLIAFAFRRIVTKDKIITLLDPRLAQFGLALSGCLNPRRRLSRPYDLRASSFNAAPRPRVGTQRTRLRPERMSPFSRGTTPAFRASTPARQQTPGAASQKQKRPCANPDCPDPNVKMTDDMSAYVCQTCGVVAADTVNLVSEPGFIEGQGGRISALGVQVAADQTHQRGMGRMQGTGNVGQESTNNRRKAEDQARTYMRGWLLNLRIPQHEAEAGLAVFGLAWQHHFNRGRPLSEVAIVCLYVALRKATETRHGKPIPKYPVMLIDFAELASVDVFSLGKIFDELVLRVFGIGEHRLANDPNKLLLAPGPEILIPRFVQSLDFPPQASNKIRDDAIKIVRRMNRDWMSDGRRPAGVCGAAVILAARMNNHRRTAREVMLTAKVAEITLNKRLEEFGDTPSSKLSVNEFRDDAVRDSIAASDPPAYTRAVLGPKRKRKRGRPAKGSEPETAAAAKRPRVDADGFVIPELPNRVAAKRKAGRPAGAKSWRPPPLSSAEARIEAELERDIDDALQQNLDIQLDDMSGPRVHNADKSNAPPVTETRPPVGAYPLYPGPSPSDPPGPPANTVAGNTGCVSMSETLLPDEFEDDPDVANCLLSEPERILKERIWVTANEDWLRQDHAKRIKRELHEAEMRERGLDPSKYTKDGRKKLKGLQWRTDGSRKAGRWGDVRYLNDPEQPGKRAGSGTPGEEGEEDGGAGQETGASSPDGQSRPRPGGAGEAVRKMLIHRTHAYSSGSRRLNLDAVHALYNLGQDDSSSMASDDNDEEGRRSRSQSSAPRPQQPVSLIRKSKHSEAAKRRIAALQADKDKAGSARGRSGSQDEDEGEDGDEDAEHTAPPPQLLGPRPLRTLRAPAQHGHFVPQTPPGVQHDVVSDCNHPRDQVGQREEELCLSLGHENRTRLGSSAYHWGVVLVADDNSLPARSSTPTSTSPPSGLYIDVTNGLQPYAEERPELLNPQGDWFFRSRQLGVLPLPDNDVEGQNCVWWTLNAVRALQSQGWVPAFDIPKLQADATALADLSIQALQNKTSTGPLVRVYGQ
ncbi:hypothetical protein DV735_g4325, partial [Chaetothyriales sp. CBS 134920]